MAYAFSDHNPASLTKQGSGMISPRMQIVPTTEINNNDVNNNICVKYWQLFV